MTHDVRHFPHTDLGNAERFVAAHGHALRYLAAGNKWLCWDGSRWAFDATLEVQRRAKRVIRDLRADVAALQEGGHRDDAKDLAKHAARSESAASMRALLECARAEAGIAITPAALDVDPWKLSVANGTLDLHTGTLRPHCPADLITKLVPVAFDPAARCDRWESFVLQVMEGNEQLVNFLQRAVGYSLTGSTEEQCVFFLYGSGANGKSTFLEILRALLNDYASQADFTTFLERQSDGPRNDVARLFGARLVTSAEVGEGKRLNESLVKSLTGSDTVTARFLHQEHFEYRPSFKLWLAANHRPVIRGTDQAIWRRFRLVPFNLQLEPAQRDPHLAETLRDELPGILAWAVAGCLLWQRDGLNPPAEVVVATDAYRRESDTLGAFLEEYCELGAEFVQPASELYRAYKQWTEVAGEFQLSQTAFGRRLEERGITAEKRGTGAARTKWRLGVRLTATFDRAAHGPPREAYDRDESLFA